MEKVTLNGKEYVVAEKLGTVYWKEGDEIGFAPMNNDGTFDEENGGVVETWEEVDEADKNAVIALLG